MKYSQVAVLFPLVGAELARLGADEVEGAVRRVVDGALVANNLDVTARASGEVERLVWSLSDVVTKLQEDEEQGKGSPVLYNQAFRRARAATALLELVEGRLGPAVSEATYALGSDEEVVLGLLRGTA